MHAKEIVEKFGGQSALASELSIGQSSIAYWVKVGTVPSKWHFKLLSLANLKHIELTIDDLQNAADSRETKGSYSTYTANKTEQNLATSQFLFYASSDGSVKVQVMLGDETVWASQKGMAEIFNVDVRTISEHLQNIFKNEELIESTTIRKFRIVVDNGKNYDVNFYNLDAIISVGYRVNSYHATQFRKWATSVLKEYLIKGFTLDDERLKQSNQLFGKDYFDELLERIREIRASERRFYQKITDIYSQCSADYDKNSPVTMRFYAHVQDKLHYAIHGHTSAELVKLRANSDEPFMGLNSWKAEKVGGKITKSDIIVGKNYLSQTELEELNGLVNMYLDFAGNFAKRHIALKMEDWEIKLDDFLKFNAYPILSAFGKVKRESAEKHAIAEYEKFRVIQDKDYESDFDKVVEEIKTNKRLPKAQNR